MTAGFCAFSGKLSERYDRFPVRISSIERTIRHNGRKYPGHSYIIREVLELQPGIFKKSDGNLLALLMSLRAASAPWVVSTKRSSSYSN
ncbi:hypothetical protein Y032_0016g2899 [Ancylostoma ceylanicum]|uniref:Uncharacterized protein n=1 Tax=Ancylostoma ceylanicum TaxID=53326 RepID=A0A016V6Q9_9BILA|nr:hypothetical protein Y032_0016g2899 [Ancylostoma ceylanicum]